MGKVPVMSILPLALFVGLAALFLGGMFRDDPDALPSVFVGKSAPDVVAEPVPGLEIFTRDDLDAPGVKLVNFFASWCAPCRVEHPNLVALAEEGIPIYGVNRDRKTEDAIAFLDELGDPYTGVVFDPTNKRSIDWGVYGLPETFVIDGDGVVRLRVAGPVTQRVLEQQVRPAIEAALAEEPDTAQNQ